MPQFKKPDGSYDREAAEAERRRLSSLPLEKRITDTDRFNCDGVTVIVETVNDIETYAQRMYIEGADLSNEDGTDHTRWHGGQSYDQMSFEHEGVWYSYFSPYWEGYYPIEQVCRVIPGTKL